MSTSIHMDASPKPSPSIDVPPGHKIYTENQTSILLPDAPDAFLNPAQEFNRDLSIACIRTWSELANETKKQKWLKKREKKKTFSSIDEPKSKKLKDDSEAVSSTPTAGPSKSSDVMDLDSGPGPDINSTRTQIESRYYPQTFVLLEALSATGLRAIRYAKEIPLLKYVIANDLSPAAIAAMKRNVELNGLAPPLSVETSQPEPENVPLSAESATKPPQGKIRINQQDACDLMYSHRSEKNRVDVVDLDPYGTAAPFMDSAIQCVRDDGLLCVTCTDTAVLANNNYPEKCFANYGGVPARAEYCHEIAIRLVLHALSNTAARYGRFITPVLSLSIDFYIRVFVRVRTAPIEVKKAISKTSIYHICVGCQAFHAQPLGKVVERTSANGQVNTLFKTSAADQAFHGSCSECGSNMHVAGPMWSGPLHDRSFVAKVLDHVKECPDNYKFSTRMEGMLTIAHEELETPFYFTPGYLAGLFHTTCPPLDDVASALLHANHAISRSHACAGSLKTTASRSDIHDIFRSWILDYDHPISAARLKDGTPAKSIMAKTSERKTANFEKHPQLATAISNNTSKVKLIRYAINPRNWGPGSKPGPNGNKEDTAGVGRKRKRDEATKDVIDSINSTEEVEAAIV